MARILFRSSTMVLPRMFFLLPAVLILHGVSDFAVAQQLQDAEMSEAVRSQWQLIESSFASKDYEAAKAGADRLLNSLADQEGVANAIQRTGKRLYRVDPAKAAELFRYNVANHADSKPALNSQYWLVRDAIIRNDEQALQAELAVLTETFAGHESMPRTIYNIATEIKRTGKTAKSLEVYRYNVDHFPASEHTLQSQWQLIKDSFVRKDYEKAKADVDILLSRFGEQKALPKTIHNAAKRFEQAGDKAKALELHRYNVEQFPTSEHTLLSQAQLIHDSFDRKDYEAAKAGTDAMLNRSASKKSTADAIQKIAKRFYEVDRAKALELYRYNLANYPDSKSAMQSQGWLIRDAIERADEQAVRAGVETLMTQFSRQKTLPNEILGLTNRYLDLDQPQKAKDLYQYIASLWEQEKETLLSLRAKALIEIKLNNFTAAQESIDAIYRDFSNDQGFVPSLIDIAQACHHAGKDAEALVHYGHIQKNTPGRDLALKARKRAALAHIGLGQDEQVQATIETLKANYRDHPGLDQAIFLIGEGYYEAAMKKFVQGETEAAEENFIKSINIWQIIVDELPDSDHAPEAHYFIAFCFKQLKQYPQAAEYFQEVIDRWPLAFTWRTYFQAGSVYESMKRTGDITESEADNKIALLYSAVINLYPNSPANGSMSYKLGKIYYKKSQWDKAIEHYEMFRIANENSPLLPYALYHLGESYEKSGQNDSARSVYEIFLEKANPANRYIRKVKEKLQNM